MDKFSGFLNELSLRSNNISISDKLIGANIYKYFKKEELILDGKIDGLDVYFVEYIKDNYLLLVNDEIIVGFIKYEYSGFKIKNSPLMSVKISSIYEELRGKGFGYKIYEQLIQRYIITNDEKNNSNSIKIWRKLAKDSKYHLYKFDISDGHISNLDTTNDGWVDEIWTSDRNNLKKWKAIRVIASRKSL